jgi:hypothetical protein
MANVRDEAARLIEIGRRIERAVILADVLNRLQNAQREADFNPLVKALRVEVEHAGLNAAEAQVAAHQLIAELSPGAALARRVLSTWHAARAAWRADVPAAQR